jgi:DNA polymerase-3 subunit gamma/tau
VSPFAADSARKSAAKPELSADDSTKAGPQLVASTSSTPVVMGAAVPVEEARPIYAIRSEELTAGDTGGTESSPPKSGLDRLRDDVLNALSNAGHRMLVSMLDAGEWRVEGNELQIKVAASASLIDMSLGADAKRLAIATASGVLGRPAKLSVVSGSVAQIAAPRAAPNGGGRGRAEQDPVVRRMREKFGAEIRTIIDYREKR